MTPAQSTGAIILDSGDLAIAASLVLAAGLVSMGLRLGLGRTLAIASVRTIVQLLLVGYVLDWVFGIDTALPLFCVLAVMILFAGRAAVERAERTFVGAFWRAGVTLAATGLLTAVVVTAGIIGVEPWYDPQYLLPVLGMILGNSLTGISLCLDKLLEDLGSRSDHIEADLAMGASRWEAAREPVAGAVRRGMIPIVNAMMVVGVVSLPGMMTG
jgi:putative ABC transport system permease protein